MSINTCAIEPVFFKGQSWFTIALDTTKDITGATFTRIRYEKPGFQTGYWEATPDGTVLEYEVQDGDIDQTGVWKFMTWVQVGGREGLGEIFEWEFFEPISE